MHSEKVSLSAYNSMRFDKHIQSCNHYQNQDMEHFYHLKWFPHYPLSATLLLASAPRNHWSLFYSYNFAFSRMSYEQKLKYVAFQAWLLSLSIILRFIRVIVYIYSFFLLNACTIICLSIHELKKSYLQFLVVINNAATNIYIHAFMWT